MTGKRNLRADMPTVAAWIDELREAFGAEQINAAIRAGIDGKPTFYAQENGIEIGIRYQPDPAKVVRGDEMAPPAWNAKDKGARK